jgi:hypothetical protein
MGDVRLAQKDQTRKSFTWDRYEISSLKARRPFFVLLVWASLIGSTKEENGYIYHLLDKKWNGRRSAVFKRMRKGDKRK